MDTGVGFRTTFEADRLLGYFKDPLFLGGGGEGTVYAVTHEQFGRVALKIAANNWRVSEEDAKVQKKVFYILSSSQSPHLTRILGVFSIRCPLFFNFNFDEKKRVFFDRLEAEGATFDRKAMLMELLDGDLEKISATLTDDERIAFKVQIASVAIVLERNGVSPHELGKFRNVVYKPLSSEDILGGKQMIAFDFWKYVFPGYMFYLPRPTYLIKVCDYDRFRVVDTPFLSDPLKCLKFLLQEEEFSLEDLETMFRLPQGKKGDILEVFNSEANGSVNSVA